ncbi:MAG: EamA family transporter [Pseudomonadota bacterium]
MTLKSAIAPLFVILWSTGFLGAKLGLPHAEPMTFLALRFGIVAVLIWAWVLLRREQRLTWRQARNQAIIGALLHSFYLGGVFVAISWGTEAGVTALIVGLQPVAMALLAIAWLGEKMRAVQWLGMALGVSGVALVVARKLGAGIGDMDGVLLCTFGLIGIAIGSVMQKRAGEDTPMLAGNAVQFASASVCCAVVAVVAETREIQWTGEFIFALVWLVVVLSLGAITIFFILIQRGAASQVGSLFFLIPPTTAIFAWFLFDERMGPVEIFGMAMAALGVLLVNRPKPAPQSGS